MEQLNIDNLLTRLNLVGQRATVALAVYNIVVKTITHLPGRAEPPPEQPEELEFVEADNRISVHEQNLLHLLDLLESYDEPCKEFMENFTKWETVRKENCSLLKYTAEYLQFDHAACTATCLGANVVAATGGIAVLSSIIFPPAAPFVLFGFVASGIGGATAFSASVADVARINKHLKKAQKITQKDTENSKLLGNWLKHSEEVEIAMNDLLGISIWKKMRDNLRVIREERNLLSQRFSTFTMLIKACVFFLPPDHALFLTVGTDVSALIITAAIAMIMFHRQSRSALNLDMLLFGMARLSASSVELGRLIVELSSKAGAAAAKLLAKRTVTGVFAGFGVALDISMIVLNSIELSKDGMCEEGQRIIRLSDSLEEERRVLRDVYQRMLIGQ